MASQAVPNSYSSLPWRNIKITTHPANAVAVTKVMVLTISRPEKLNAFTPVIEEDMVRAFDLFDRDDRVRAVVVTGEGRTFCAGTDIEIGLHREEGESPKDHRDSGGRVSLAIHRCRKPVIAAIHGAAVGIGITMTLPMSIRVVSATAKIGFVFSQRGVVMEACSSFFLPRLIGYSNALYMTTTGAVIPAASPQVQGLFAEIMPGPEAVLPRALELATGIAENTSVVSTYLMREMMWRNPGSAEGAHLLDSEIMWHLYGGNDKREGFQSFLEKRPAKFSTDIDNAIPANCPWWEPLDIGPRRKKDSKFKL